MNFDIESVDPVEFSDGKTLPTAIFYTALEEFVIGEAALRKETDTLRANTGFKIALGQLNPKTVVHRKTFPTACAAEKTAFEMSRNFILGLLENGQNWLHSKQLAPAGRIMVAEPLQFYTSDEHEDWLANYRAHVKRMLSTHYDEVEFLPEPFAVFQYYKHYKKVGAVLQKRRYVALVLDFGGGTFDSSVIITSKQGELSGSGYNSRPLAASSVAVGGRSIDHEITKYCMLKALESDKEKKQLKTIFNKAAKWTDDQIGDLNSTNQSVYRWLQKMQGKSEQAKIELCGRITDWSLSNVCDKSVSIDTPKNPFEASSDFASVQFSSRELYSLFFNEIWKNKLQSAVKSALRRADEALDNKPVNLLLLSGGSCNVGWVQKLLEKEFASYLADATIISFTRDYQQIVAQGLAVECARRHLLSSDEVSYKRISEKGNLSSQSADRNLETASDAEEIVESPNQQELTQKPSIHSERNEANPGSGFDGVTYNSVFLTLQPDDAVEQHVRARPWRETKEFLNEAKKPGVLLDSGTQIQNLVDKKLMWKLELSRAPRRTLTYHFSRSSEIPAQPTDVYNPMGNRVDTGHFKSFGSSIMLELFIREDGTCEPCFVYKWGKEESPDDVKRVGVPFALDTTALNLRTQPVQIPEPQTSQQNKRVLPEVDQRPISLAQSRGEANNVSTSENADIIGPESEAEQAYFGFDFGTTNSSLSYVSRTSIDFTEQRRTDTNWDDLADCVDELPAPVATAAYNYMRSKAEKERSNNALTLFEASYAFLAYLAYSEARGAGRKDTRLLKSFRHRSAGPLVDLLDESLKKLGAKANIAKPLLNLQEKLVVQSNDVRNELNDLKHEKREALSQKTLDFCEATALCVAKVMEDKLFGCFLDVRKEQFSQVTKAQFRIYHGSPHFTEAYDCEAKCDLLSNVPYILDKEGNALCVAPLILNGLGEKPEDQWIFDMPCKNGKWAFKSALRTQSIEIGDDHSSGAHNLLEALYSKDGAHLGDIDEKINIKLDD